VAVARIALLTLRTFFPTLLWYVNGRYIFFEKKRIAEGKGKSPSRLNQEIRTRGRPSEVVLEYKGEEVVCDEDDKGKLIVRETGKLFKVI
jgi:hypothetical protein